MAHPAYGNGGGYGAMEPAIKRSRVEQEYGGVAPSNGPSYTGGPILPIGSGPGPNLPSRVVRVSSLPPSVTDADLIDVFQSNWGPVNYIQFNSAKEADIEFEEVESAQKCVTHCQNTPIYVLQSPVYASYSSLQGIPRKRGESETPSRVLYMQVLNPRFGIDVNVVNQICKTIAPINRISIQKASGGGVVEVLAEFASVQAARDVKIKLNGCDIYSGCCTLKIEYSSMDHVSVARNCDDQWDYSGKGNPPGSDKSRPSLLQDPAAQHYGGGPPQQPAAAPKEMGIRPPMPYGMGPGMPPRFPPADPYGEFVPPPGMPPRFMPPPPPFGFPPPPGFPGGLPPPPGSQMHPPTVPDGCGMGMPGGVMMIYGLVPSRMNCDRLFNLLCLYGNVQKIWFQIKFLKSKPDTAMVQMGDRTAAARAVEYLNRFSLFGQKLSFSLSKQDFLQEIPNSIPLEDGTPSYKDYTTCRNNRYLTEENSKKNRLVEPSRNVYFFNAPPDITESELVSVFTDAGSTAPVIKIFPNKQAENARSTAGIAEFPNDEEALGGLVLANHTSIPSHRGKYPFVIKMSFCGPPTTSNGMPGGGGGGHPPMGGGPPGPYGGGGGYFPPPRAPGPPFPGGRGGYGGGRGSFPPGGMGRGAPHPHGDSHESQGILWGSGGKGGANR